MDYLVSCFHMASAEAEKISGLFYRSFLFQSDYIIFGCIMLKSVHNLKKQTSDDLFFV